MPVKEAEKQRNSLRAALWSQWDNTKTYTLTHTQTHRKRQIEATTNKQIKKLPLQQNFKLKWKWEFSCTY